MRLYPPGSPVERATEVAAGEGAPPDESGPARIGLVVPAECHLDDEAWSLAWPEAIPYVTRALGASDERMGADPVATVSSLNEGFEIGDAAVRLVDVSPAAAAYLGTAVSLVRGTSGDLEVASRLREVLGCPAMTATTAAVAAFRALGVERIAALSPYGPELDERMTAYFASRGLEMAVVRRLRRTYADGATSRALGRTPPGDLLEDAAPVREDGVEALFLPSAAVRSLEAIAALEAALGMPVVSAVGAAIWAVLRLAGVSAERPAGGRLFSIAELPEAFRPVSLT